MKYRHSSVVVPHHSMTPPPTKATRAKGTSRRASMFQVSSHVMNIQMATRRRSKPRPQTIRKPHCQKTKAYTTTSKPRATRVPVP